MLVSHFGIDPNLVPFAKVCCACVRSLSRGSHISFARYYKHFFLYFNSWPFC